MCFDSYARYHNYTLQQAIRCKIEAGKQFKEADLLYVMGNLLTVGDKVVSVMGPGYRGLFKAHNIFLSTEGYVKVYPFTLNPINSIAALEDTSQSVSSNSEYEG